MKLSEPTNLKSAEVNFTAPAHNFVEFKSPYLDHAWKNNNNGNTISYLSECNSQADPTLENIHRGIISEIEAAKSIEFQHIEFNEREALHSTLHGKVDGVSTQFELIIFKKNSCTYVLTYAAKSEDFGTDQSEFSHFVNGFKIP